MSAPRELFLKPARNARAEQADAFIEIAHGMARGLSDAAILRNSANPALVIRAPAQDLDDFALTTEISELAPFFLGSNEDGSLIDAALRYAMIVPPTASRVLSASGYVGNAVAEGTPKVVHSIALFMDALEPVKAQSIIVLTDELMRASGNAARRLFEIEMRKAVTRADNAAFMGQITGSDTVALASTGDALADLRLGLRNADPSAGYVVAASPAIAADLSTRVENRGMTPRGGEFSPGVSVVTIDDLTGLRVIPASRLVLQDFGLEFRPSRDATVNMSPNPVTPSQLVSLFQLNLLGLLAERTIKMSALGVSIVSVGA